MRSESGGRARTYTSKSWGSFLALELLPLLATAYFTIRCSYSQPPSQATCHSQLFQHHIFLHTRFCDCSSTRNHSWSLVSYLVRLPNWQDMKHNQQSHQQGAPTHKPVCTYFSCFTFSFGSHDLPIHTSSFLCAHVSHRHILHFRSPADLLLLLPLFNHYHHHQHHHQQHISLPTPPPATTAAS